MRVCTVPRPQRGVYQTNALRIELSTALAGKEWQQGGFEEGAFAYVNFPALSSSIWLPVTIPSAPVSLAASPLRLSAHRCE